MTNLSDAITAAGSCARSLACFERHMRAGTFDTGAALRLLDSDVRSIARRAGIECDTQTRAIHAAQLLREWLDSQTQHA